MNELDALWFIESLNFSFSHKNKTATFHSLFCLQKRREKMSCARPPNILLRKQKSLVCESVCQPVINTRERRLRLQKQYSVDQSRDTVNNNQRSIHAPNQLKNGNLANNSWSGSNSSPEASLRIFTAIKAKTQQNHNGCEPNEECVFTICNLI